MEKASDRVVLHIDLDAFFAAVEERDHPAFRGFPVVVGADPKAVRAAPRGELRPTGRGVVSTANYAARKYGVHSAQPISKAWQLCKEGEAKGGKPCIFFEGNFEKYGRESTKVMAIIRTYSENFEQAGIDEAYIELNPNDQTPMTKWRKKATQVAKEIKRQIKQQTKLICSIGIGPNKLVAKIASDFKKPDGLTVVPPEKVQEFLDPMPVLKIPGIGPKANLLFEKRGIRTVAALRKISRDNLIAWFGKWGEGIYTAARGKDNRPVREFHETKSIGREHTFDEDTFDAQELIATIKKLAAMVARDTKEENISFRTIELKIRSEGFITKTRAKTLPQAEKSTAVLERVGMALLLPFLDRRENPQHKKIRLLGLRVSNLVSYK